MGWYVLEFSSEIKRRKGKAVGWVTEKWIVLKNNQRLCYWPNQDAKNKNKREVEPKNSKQWTLHEFRFLMNGAKFETYESAKEAAEIAENHSSMSSFAKYNELAKNNESVNNASIIEKNASVSSNTNNKLKRKAREVSLSSESEDGENIKNMKSIPSIKKNKRKRKILEASSSSSESVNTKNIKKLKNLDANLRINSSKTYDYAGFIPRFSSSKIATASSSSEDDKSSKRDEISSEDGSDDSDDDKSSKRDESLSEKDGNRSHDENLIGEVIQNAKNKSRSSSSGNSDDEDAQHSQLNDCLKEAVPPLQSCDLAFRKELSELRADVKEVKKIVLSSIHIFKDLTAEVFACKEEIRKRNGLFTDLLHPDIQLPIDDPKECELIMNTSKEKLNVKDNLIKFIASTTNESNEADFVKSSVKTLFTNDFFMTYVSWKPEPNRVFIKKSEIMNCWRESFKLKFGLNEPRKSDKDIEKFIYATCRQLKDTNRKAEKKE